MKEIYKNTFIYKVCEDLNIDIKELSFIMNKTLKCIENWRKDENFIPPREKQYMKLLIKNKKLQNELKSLDCHKVEAGKVSSDEFGSTTVDIHIENGTLKRLCEYRVILKEIR